MKPLSLPLVSRSGILYGNPKAHKPVADNMPKFRPIVSAINTPGYNLAKFLIPVLEPLTDNKFTVLQDCFALVLLKKLQNMIVPFLWEV